MLRTILIFGAATGAIIALVMFSLITLAGPGSAAGSQFAGYLIMILALSLIFVGVKQFRDRTLGGVIKFLPAFLIGLGISAVASVIYVVGWEITLAATDYAFMDDYTAATLETARAKGASPEDLDRMAAEMEAFKTQYANPLFRLPITFVEVFPVGLLVSLISAALLRNSRFMPARAPRG